MVDYNIVSEMHSQNKHQTDNYDSVTQNKYYVPGPVFLNFQVQRRRNYTYVHARTHARGLDPENMDTISPDTLDTVSCYMDTEPAE